MKEICFHNWGRKGDLHVSRSFVKRIAELSQVPCCYYHAEDPALLCDIQVQHRPRSQIENRQWSYTTTFLKNESLFINTWYAAGKHRFRSPHADDLVTFDCLYRLFQEACQRLDLSMEQMGTPTALLPRINWKAFPATNQVSDYMNSHAQGSRVFLDTVDCLSGQASNFPLIPVLRAAASQRPNVTFYYTWAAAPVRAALPGNCVWTRDVHGVREGIDLNENAFISTYCQVIAGRNSSSYTYALCHENLVQRSTRFLEFSTLPYPLAIGPWYRERSALRCSVLQSRTTSRNEAVKLLLGLLP